MVALLDASKSSTAEGVRARGVEVEVGETDRDFVQFLCRFMHGCADQV